MSVETLVAEIVALTSNDEAPDDNDLAKRHQLPVETVRRTISNLVAAATVRSMPVLYWRTIDAHRQLPTSEVSSSQRDPARPQASVSSPDRSPRSLVLVLARAAERLRTDPEANFEDGAVRAAAGVLRARLDERLADSAGAARDGVEGS